MKNVKTSLRRVNKGWVDQIRVDVCGLKMKTDPTDVICWISGGKLKVLMRLRATVSHPDTSQKLFTQFELLFVAVFDSCLKSFVFSDVSEHPWTRSGDVIIGEVFICKQIRIFEPVDGSESSISVRTEAEHFESTEEFSEEDVYVFAYEASRIVLV
ncbi:hypothetical protein L1987_15619 [Smallanthus sonchifolius]|uniref:Uncharacterized protein n=1 Tax=Smallanthus sonchifolius TaxID=185202 RepID=A0ACB9J869_9ASTR|nr:hypothetical protein L1987_15619 [Smallanthus sonchifolius]